MTNPPTPATPRSWIKGALAALLAALSWEACSDRIQPTAPGAPALAVQSGDTITLSGTLFDRNGVPIPDSVQVCAAPGALACTVWGNGGYSIQLPPDTDTLSLVQRGDTLATSVVPGTFYLSGAIVTLSSDSVMNFKLPNVFLTVRVLGPDSQPVPNMLIEASGSPVFPLFPGGWVFGWQKTTRYSDSTGVARLPLFADTALTLTVTPSVESGLGRVEFDGLVMDADQTIPIVLEPAGPPPAPVTFSGTLRDRDGDPIPDSIVVSLFGAVSYGAVSAGDGRFSFTVSAGTYTVDLNRWAFGSLQVPHTTPSYFFLSGPTIGITTDRVQDLTLHNAVLQVTVLGPDGQPLPRAEVTAAGQPVLEVFPGGWFYGSQWDWSLTDATGAARLAVLVDSSLSLTVHPRTDSGLPDTTLWNVRLNHDTALTIALGVVPVAIDVKPGDSANVINLQSALVPVAVMSSATFDATTSDDRTVAFAGAYPDQHRGIDDVNGDGLLDVVFHFPTGGLSLPLDATRACLSGRTLTGRFFRGCDAVQVIAP